MNAGILSHALILLGAAHGCNKMLLTMNPYASYLGERDPNEVIAGTAKKLRQYADVFGSRRLGQAPAPGKWSAREILCHLADCEIVFAYRLRQTLAEDHHNTFTFATERGLSSLLFRTFTSNWTVLSFLEFKFSIPIASINCAFSRYP